MNAFEATDMDFRDFNKLLIEAAAYCGAVFP